MGAAREQVLSELDALERRRWAALGVCVALLAAMTAAATARRPEVLGPLLALDASVLFALAAGLGAPRGLPAIPLGVLALGMAGLSVALLARDGTPGEGVGVACMAEGTLAGLLGAGGLTIALAPLLRRSIDVRWAVGLGAASLALGALAWMCPRHDALHLWASHLPILLTVYLAARLVFGVALPHDPEA